MYAANEINIIKNYFSLAIVARNSTQTAVTNLTIKCMLENKIIYYNFNLIFRMFLHTSSEVTVNNTSSN